MDLETSVLRLSAVILRELNDSSIIPLDELLSKVEHSVGERARFNVLPALNFLFALGKVDYNSEVDAVVSCANGQK